MTESDRVSANARRSSLAGLADYLAGQQTVILEQWLIVVRRDPRIETADRLPPQQLIDHLPRLLKELCDFLRTRNAADLFGEARRDAQHHGELRWQDGYRIDEVLLELEAFRQLIAAGVFHYRDRTTDFEGPLQVSASALVHQFFAEISVASVRQFVLEQDSLHRASVQQLTSAHQDLGRANAKLAQNLSDRERATTMVSHEIRNFLQTMPREAPELRGFLNQLLEYTELTGRGVEVVHAPFDPRLLFADLAAVYEPTAEQKGLEWLADAATAPAEVDGDRAATQRIAEMLLNNACDNTLAGRITFRFAAEDTERWSIFVEDTGPGLSNEASEGLFSGSSPTAQQWPARGLGLAIAKNLISHLGGTFHAVTQTAVGTSIKVTLPNAHTEVPVSGH